MIEEKTGDGAGSGARYRGLLETAPDAMVVVDDRGRIVLLNLRAENLFGYRRTELVGRKIKKIIPNGFEDRLMADGRLSTAEKLATQIGLGIELVARRKGGSDFPVELMLSPLESTDGLLVTAAIRDITKRKEAERNLLEDSGRYRGLLEAAPDAMVVVNKSGTIVLLNLEAERQFGYRREDLVGQDIKSIVPQGLSGQLPPASTNFDAGGSTQRAAMGIEGNGRRKDGSEFPI